MEENFSKTYNEEDFTKLYNGNIETNDYNKVKEIEILTKTNKIMNQQQTDVSEISDIKDTNNNEKNTTPRIFIQSPSGIFGEFQGKSHKHNTWFLCHGWDIRRGHRFKKQQTYRCSHCRHRASNGLH